MSSLVQVPQTQTVVVQSQVPDSVNILETERVVSKEETTTVVVTGLLGPSGITTLSGASDLDLSGLTDGATLVYQQNIAKWLATKELDNQVMNGGFF